MEAYVRTYTFPIVLNATQDVVSGELGGQAGRFGGLGGAVAVLVDLLSSSDTDRGNGDEPSCRRGQRYSRTHLTFWPSNAFSACSTINGSITRLVFQDFNICWAESELSTPSLVGGTTTWTSFSKSRWTKARYTLAASDSEAASSSPSSA